MIEGHVQVTQGFVGAAVADVGQTGAPAAGGGVPVCDVQPATARLIMMSMIAQRPKCVNFNFIKSSTPPYDRCTLQYCRMLY